MKNFSQYKNLVMVIAIIVAFTWTFKTIIFHYNTKWQALEAKKAALDRGKTLIERWLQLNGEYDAISRNFFKKDPALFKRFVEDKAQFSDVVVNSISPTRAEDSLVVTITMNLKTSSSYRGFLSFIKSLEEKNIEIDRLFLKRGADGKAIEEDLILKSFIIKE